MKSPKYILALMMTLFFLAACSPRVEEPPPIVVDLSEEETVPTPKPETSPSSSTASAGSRSDEDVVLSRYSEPVTATGELLILYGYVLDSNGVPLNGAAVEIWQVDASGNYDHPQDPNTENRDMNFQFYGTSITDENGLYSFRTLVPARYEPRPRHIHFKVKMDGQVLITSQFYFAEDVDASDEMLLLDVVEAQDGAGNVVMLSLKDIVVGTGGELPSTPMQAEGPYYPVVDVSIYDSDLASVQ